MQYQKQLAMEASKELIAMWKSGAKWADVKTYLNKNVYNMTKAQAKVKTEASCNNLPVGTTGCGGSGSVDKVLPNAGRFPKKPNEPWSLPPGGVSPFAP